MLYAYDVQEIFFTYKLFLHDFVQNIDIYFGVYDLKNIFLSSFCFLFKVHNYHCHFLQKSCHVVILNKFLKHIPILISNNCI